MHDEAPALLEILKKDYPSISVTTAFDAAAMSLACSRATLGDRSLVFAHPDSWGALSSVLGLEIHDRHDRNPAWPHVTVNVPASGAGRASGSSLMLRHGGGISTALDSEKVALWGDGSTAAVTLARGRGSVTVVVGVLCPGYAALAASWARLACGLPDPATAEESKGSTPALDARTPAGDLPTVSLEGWRPPAVVASSVNDPAVLQAAAYAGRTLPAAVYQALVDFADGRTESPALLLRGCPLGAVPETPPAPQLARKSDLVSETTLLTIARVLGQPAGYGPEHGGDLVQNVCPIRSHADRQTSTSSAVVLELHTEAAFHPVLPRYLALLCLRSDPRSATTLTSVDALVRALSSEEQAVLSQARFTTGVDESYTHVRGTARSAPAPILDGSPLSPRLWLDNDLMEGVDEEAQKALETAARLARELARGVVLEEGDMLIVDNHRAVHGRTPFSPRFDGTDRWLQRALIVTDHRAAGADLVGRTITTEFNTVS